MDQRETTPAPVYFVNDTQQDDELSDIGSSSPSDSTDETMSTLASEEAIEYFQLLNGRMFPKDENMPIAIPTDTAELKRLMLQHIQLKIFLGANYVGPVRDMLSPSTNGREKKVLDLITAEGSWVQEMAKEFPHVQFTTVDNVPLLPHAPLPNARFEVYDLYNGIAEQADTFDMVHLRHAAMHLKNPKALIREIYRVLRPGGIFLFGNWELSAYDATDPSRPAFERLPGLTKALQMTRTALTHQGVDVQMCSDMPRWLEPSSELWTAPEDPSSGLMFTEPMLGFRDIYLLSVERSEPYSVLPQPSPFVPHKKMSDSSRPSSPVSAPAGQPPRPGSGNAISKPPGAGQVRRRANNQATQKPNSARAAGAGGSSSTMLKLYTDDSQGLRVDPFVVMMLSLSFIASIFFLHISAKLVRYFSK
ncbi:unnamed protein product [Rhizoctonia solani]|uniref:Methyltransferase type 11 domain-containing protein n=1 Tax=Rhizoctonia solani TaxID=456999 RepID=A0A8H3HBH0_9AGAM|nr:unnamed protein product [Rhizoctonia solani]